jgi:hypothetical protein
MQRPAKSIRPELSVLTLNMRGAMAHLKLKYVLASLVWFCIALAIAGDYYREHARFEAQCAEIEQSLANHPMGLVVCLRWQPRIRPMFVLPLLIVGVLTLVGRWRVGLVIGLPTVAGIGYELWTWHLREAALMSAPGA